MISTIKVSRTSSSPSKGISIQISIRVRLRSIKIIEPEMPPYFWPCCKVPIAGQETRVLKEDSEGWCYSAAMSSMVDDVDLFPCVWSRNVRNLKRVL